MNPKPGLVGNYRDSCIICLKGTDTAIAFQGPAEFALVGLMALGVPEDEAQLMVEKFTGSDPGNVPAGDVTIPVRVCQGCADASGRGLPAGLLPNIPLVKYRA